MQANWRQIEQALRQRFDAEPSLLSEAARDFPGVVRRETGFELEQPMSVSVLADGAWLIHPAAGPDHASALSDTDELDDELLEPVSAGTPGNKCFENNDGSFCCGGETCQPNPTPPSWNLDSNPA
jgi:hypothetical protein